MNTAVQAVKARFNIDFVGKFPMAVIFSVLLVAGSLGILATKGINYGVDFRGGAEVQIQFSQTVTGDQLRAALKTSGIMVSSIQTIGDESANEKLLKIPASSEDLNKVTDQVTKILLTDFAAQGANIRKTDIVGAKAGEQLRISGFKAMLWAMLAIMIYIGLRFDIKYAPGAIVALFHDVLIIVGIFALVEKEFSLQIVGALLAVIGYSVNDTVVVYDRVRENEEASFDKDLKVSINKSLNETLTRTILTSITTLCVSLVMFFMGGGVIHDFFFAISLGVIIGTYSSVFIAAPTVLAVSKFMPEDED